MTERDPFDPRGVVDPLFADGSDQATMMRMIFHARLVAQVVRSVAVFALADHLAEGPATAEQVAALAGLEPRASYRLLRYCSVIGLTVVEADGRFAATPLLRTLKSDDPRSLRDFALAQNGPGQWAVLGKLDEALRTDRPQAAPVLGCGLYDYYSAPEHADEARSYRQALNGINLIVAADLAKIIDTTGMASALDVGGSLGTIVLALMQQNPSLHGTVLDVAAVEKDATQAAGAQGLSDRFSFIAGDFFAEVPSSDLYILKNVLGNWPEDRCRTILRNCRKSAPDGGRIVVVESMIDDANPSRWSLDVDMVTLVMVGGEGRSRAAYEDLLADAGFAFAKFTETASFFSVIEAVAVE